MHHAQIAQRAFNTPLMVDPAKALAFLSGLGPRITGQEIIFQGLDVDIRRSMPQHALPARASLFGTDLAQRHQRNGSQPFAVVDGIAVIEIAGTLVHRGAWIGQSSGLTSYEGHCRPDAGGAGRSRPFTASRSTSTASVGRSRGPSIWPIASGPRGRRNPSMPSSRNMPCPQVTFWHRRPTGSSCPAPGAVGSIGVVALHTDMSGALDQKGIAVTLIHAGSHKVDANPYQPLPEAVHNQMQRELEVVRLLFAETVAAGRGDRLTQARGAGHRSRRVPRWPMPSQQVWLTKSPIPSPPSAPSPPHPAASRSHQ